MMKDDTHKHLNIKRGQLKAQLTRFSTYLDTFDDDKDYLQLQSRLEKVDILWGEFDKVQGEIDILLDGVDADNEREIFENKYFKAISHAKKLLTTQNDEGINLSMQNMNIRSQVKLPVLSLPQFYGAYEQWMNFYDTFNGLINNNTSLSNVEKFYYLQTSLKGEAAQVISSIEVSDSNFELAWNLLKERYENKKIIVHRHVQGIFELPIVKQESHVQLRKFLDTFLKDFRSLKALGQPIDSWDTILIYILTQKLDQVTKREWENETNDKQFHTVTEFIDFLTKRCQLLEKLEVDSTVKVKYKNDHHVNSLNHLTTQQYTCCFCKQNHANFQCETLQNMPVNDRYLEVKKYNLCTNCLRPNHTNSECMASNCRTCHRKHHSLLHFENKHSQANDAHIESKSNIASASNIATYTIQQRQQQVLLSTALINIVDIRGNATPCRALLDSWSQSNFITAQLLRKLGLKATKIDMPITGISQSLTYISNHTQATIQSMHNNYTARLSFLILDRITENIPQSSFDMSNMNIHNLKLADPDFNKPGPIDLLLGADIFWHLLCVGQIKDGRNTPIFQKTRLGWIVAGSIPHKNKNTSLCHLSIADQKLHDQLENFWKIEEIQTIKGHYTREELECENHFIKTFKRDVAGCFTVQLPIRDNVNQIGNSLNIAEKRFYNLERKLQRNDALKTFYTNFMHEYEQLGHMSKINKDDITGNNQLVCYLPHHGVVKESSTTTKLRVVFDASAKTDSGTSLNDILKTGPVIQDELFSIVLRFRKHTFVMTADISKMYRQINVDPSHRDLQRIVWRANPSHDLEHYRLNTVTYGTGPASFLAIRTMHQVANENTNKHPEASRIIRSDFYVDDLMTGTDNLENAKALCWEISTILESAGFELRKWNSNNKTILNTTHLSDLPEFYIDDTTNSKALGLLWNSHEDILQYSINLPEKQPNKITKRIILSTISRIFDPLGLVGPATIKVKVLLQKLWQVKLGWDESVPLDIHTAWLQFIKGLRLIKDISIPRQSTIANYLDIQLHGFCDASEQSFGACLYIRCSDINNSYFVKLLCAKSKVAPLKKISLPRLELCGATLLARLTKKVTASLSIEFSRIHLWSDSTITLAWISAESNRWKTFVANRVAEIQDLTSTAHWRHVKSEQNPADIISRGIDPELLEGCELWWHGPEWLGSNENCWPERFDVNTQTSLHEEKRTKQFTFVVCADDDIFYRYSSFSRLHRVFAYCLRFINNLKPTTNRITGSITNAELSESLNKLVQLVQAQVFNQEINSLTKEKLVSRKSKLLSLSPFLDESNIIRVGGRIRNSSFSFDKKHPILLPANHAFTDLLIKQEHHKLLHAGPQAVLCSIRNKFWILNGKNSVKRMLRTCITCFRAKPYDTIQPMGNLPAARVAPTRPFTSTGVDFAGPFLIKDGKLRNRRTVKVYLCIFVCFSTKAVHLEIVGDLTAEGFLKALKRFVSRRGICTNIYSDNGLNFVGADNELRRSFQIVFDFNSRDNAIVQYLNTNVINWHFIPPRSPHFGGLWEAGVKSAKFHMKRILGNSLLTFEDFYTVVVQIEAVLNSRPITPLSCDPNDLIALTPSHFLIGDILTAIPQENVESILTNRLTLYKRLQQLTQHFWRRWSSEYISNLHNRTKWKLQEPIPVLKNALVLLKEENLPPLHWKLGRIVETHPGADNIVRVVTVKTSTGVFKRAVAKICILPLETEPLKTNLSLSRPAVCLDLSL